MNKYKIWRHIDYLSCRVPDFTGKFTSIYFLIYDYELIWPIFCDEFSTAFGINSAQENNDKNKIINN